jgi:hypothetical protein
MDYKKHKHEDESPDMQWKEKRKLLCLSREKADDPSYGPHAEKQYAPYCAGCRPEPSTTKPQQQSSNTKRHQHPSTNQKTETGWLQTQRAKNSDQSDVEKHKNIHLDSPEHKFHAAR